jgi:hypothetical protein
MRWPHEPQNRKISGTSASQCGQLRILGTMGRLMPLLARDAASAWARAAAVRATSGPPASGWRTTSGVGSTAFGFWDFVPFALGFGVRTGGGPAAALGGGAGTGGAAGAFGFGVRTGGACACPGLSSEPQNRQYRYSSSLFRPHFGQLTIADSNGAGGAGRLKTRQIFDLSRNSIT